MSEARRDPNRVTVWLGWDGTTTRPLLVDPTSGRLLAVAVSSSMVTIPVSQQILKRDQNFVHVVGAVTNDAAQTIVPLPVTSAGSLLCA